MQSYSSGRCRGVCTPRQQSARQPPQGVACPTQPRCRRQRRLGTAAPCHQPPVPGQLVQLAWAGSRSGRVSRVRRPQRTAAEARSVHSPVAAKEAAGRLLPRLLAGQRGNAVVLDPHVGCHRL